MAVKSSIEDIQQGLKYMSLCNKAGIRIYPVVDYGKYRIEIEFNRSPDFLSREVIQKKKGDIRFDPNGNEWVEKVCELYEHLYKTKVMAKSMME